MTGKRRTLRIDSSAHSVARAKPSRCHFYRALLILSVAALLSLLIPTVLLAGQETAAGSDGKKIIFIAGNKDHKGGDQHEWLAGCQVMAEAIRQNMPGYRTVIHAGGWPDDPAAFNGADCVVVYSGGAGGHPLIRHLEQFDKVIKRGVGLACIHYAVEVPKGSPGDHFLDWLGGYFELDWSVNPHWTARFEPLPNHPITRGVKPFTIKDEWYYHMRFREKMQGVTPILTDLPPQESLKRADGGRSGNAAVRAAIARGEPQHLAWAYERPDGSRGFGFTGAHFIQSFAHDDVRKLLLNAIVWTAKGRVPAQGVSSRGKTVQQLFEITGKRKPQRQQATHSQDTVPSPVITPESNRNN